MRKPVTEYEMNILNHLRKNFTIDNDSYNTLINELSKEEKSIELLLIEKEILDESGIQKIVFSNVKSKKIEDVLLKTGRINRTDLFKLLQLHGVMPTDIGKALMNSGAINSKDVARATAELIGCEFVDFSKFEPPVELLQKYSIGLMQKYNFLIIRESDDELHVAYHDVNDIKFVEFLEKTLGKKVVLVLGAKDDIDRTIDLFLETGIEEEIVFHELREFLRTDASDEDVARRSPIVKLVDNILVKAIRKKASDIHFEVYEDIIKIKFRIDGVLFEVLQLNERYKDILLTRLKIISELDIAEKRKPQDGRFRHEIDGRNVDFRVSILPSIYGETAVLRILDKSAQGLELERLGFDAADLKKFRKSINRPYGMVLVSGPTGSGKTTTLYSALREVNRPEDKIITVEDPVEYELPDIIQVNVNERKGLTFASGLRSIVRQDPDIVMVGEIRDKETALIAVNAALTGHLVFSTIHANNTVDTISRLQHMGVETFQFVSSVNMIVAQRLVRVICKNCKTQDSDSFYRYRDLMDDAEKYENEIFYIGKGCRFCHNTGYSGRIGIYEILMTTSKLKTMMLSGKSPLEMKKQAQSEGMISLRNAAWTKGIQGITSIPEINRTTFEESF
ncbi:type II/IV secretion system protein [bacterium]|nr:type II/IV secretion system protein [bacterium]